MNIILAEDNIRDHFPASAPMVLHKLRKEYPGPGGGPPYVAVHSISLAIDRNECFGLLGPNGEVISVIYVIFCLNHHSTCKLSTFSFAVIRFTFIYTSGFGV